MELPATTHRVPMHTDAKVNRKIMKDMEYRLWYYLDHPEEIADRLTALDKEWDMERALEANASSLALTGVFLSVFAGKKFLLVPMVVSGFLLQHALQGWCPPVPVFRRLGFRTQSEIELERYALRALRGDFRGLDTMAEAGEEHRIYPRKVLRALAH